MSPEELIHFADRIAMIGVYEGLWWAIERGKGDPDGLRVRLHGGTLALVRGRGRASAAKAIPAGCVSGSTTGRWPLWSAGATAGPSRCHGRSTIARTSTPHTSIAASTCY